MLKNRLVRILIGLAGLIVLAIILYNLPPIHSRLAWRIEDLRTRIKYFFDPPDEVIFLPNQQTDPQTLVETIVAGTLQALQTPTLTPTPTLLKPSGPTLTPTITPTPLPAFVSLPGVIYVDQHNRWNYCGPANLTMALKFWGWKGNRDDVAAVVKPGITDPSIDFITRGKTDKNVMPNELTNFVQNYTDFNVVLRYGGDVDLVRRLVAAGFPVVAEKGYYEADYTGKIGWMGHYQFITGYDDSSGELIVQDTYNDGPNFHIKYAKFEEGWRAFDYVFFIVYPPERESEVFNLLGPWADPVWGYQHALEIANREITSTTGMDLYFAWFSKGTSHVLLTQYSDAAIAYDYAFALYAQLGDTTLQRPYRMMWYQTGPYKAYFFTNRYPDVINLADATLEFGPTLEESLYWRGMAEYALGDTVSAFDDMREAVRLNPNFQAGLDKMEEWGLSP